MTSCRSLDGGVRFLILALAILCVSSAESTCRGGLVALGGLEDYSKDFVDVTNQTMLGNWTKVDAPNPVLTQGELVTSGAFGSVSPRSGEVFLDLRTESQYVTGNDGANYSYGINSLDFGGQDPASLMSGQVQLDFWVCPDTWSNDANGGAGWFIPEGLYQTTSLRNGDGDVLVSVGMYALGNQNSPEVRYSVDGTNWLSTGLQADSGTWTEVSLIVDLDAKTSQVHFTDSGATTFSSADLAWTSGITDTTVQTLNFQMDDGVGKNFYDDFSFTTSTPEPSSAILALFGLSIGIVVRRRRA